VPLEDTRAAVEALADGTASLADLRQIVVDFPQLRSVVAAYGATDEALLAWLAALHDPAVDAQLARRAGSSVAPAPTQPLAPTQPFSSAQPLASTQPFSSAQPFAAAQPLADQDTTARRPAPAASPAEGSATPAKRPSWLLIGVIVGALVLVGGGIGAAFATGLIGGRTPSATASRPAAPASGLPTAPSSAPATSAAPSATPSAPTQPASYTCWDGSEVASLSGCSMPTTKDADWTYLRYAYPSIATHTDCAKADSTGKSGYAGITLMWECELGDALIRYRFWQKSSDANHHFGDKFSAKNTLKTYSILIGGETAQGWLKTDRKTAKGPGGVKRVILTVYLPKEHLSLSVEGNTTKTMWAAFDLVRIRPIAQVLGHAAGEDPAEAPITAEGR
jgi:hypothetical protein